MLIVSVWIAAGVLGEGWWLWVGLAVFGASPIVGFVLAWRYLGRGGARLLRPLIPYGVLAGAFAVAPVILVVGTWLWWGNGDGETSLGFVIYLYAIPALPVAIAGSSACCAGSATSTPEGLPN